MQRNLNAASTVLHTYARANDSLITTIVSEMLVITAKGKSRSLVELFEAKIFRQDPPLQHLATSNI